MIATVRVQLVYPVLSVERQMFREEDLM